MSKKPLTDYQKFVKETMAKWEDSGIPHEDKFAMIGEEWRNMKGHESKKAPKPKKVASKKAPKPKKVASKKASGPKKPLTDYQKFVKETLAKWVDSGIPHADKFAMIGEEWRNMKGTESKKAPKKATSKKTGSKKVASKKLKESRPKRVIKKSAHQDFANTNLDDKQLIEKIKNGEFVGVTSVNLRGTDITDKGAKALAKSTHIKDVNLSNTAITDVGLRALAKNKNIVGINVTNTLVTEAERRKTFGGV